MKAAAIQTVNRIGASAEPSVLAFSALAHEGRLAVFFFLVKARREVSPGEIQRTLDIPGPTLSHHLDVLRRAELVSQRREQRHIYYAVNRAAVVEIVRLMTACC